MRLSVVHKHKQSADHDIDFGSVYPCYSNIHPVLDAIKVHSEVSKEMDDDHEGAMTIALGEVSDEQLLGKY